MELSLEKESAGLPHKSTKGTPVPLFLRPPEGEPLDGVLGWLAQRFGLNTFSTSLLGSRGRLEMKAAALVLLVVFLFDLGAWTLLFNTILEGELLKVGATTPLALLAGCLFAAMVVLYERQFLTADLSPGWRRLVFPTLIRFLVILGSALITAQPVELLFFRQAVLARIHQEGIRQQVATQREHLNKLEALIAEKKQALADLPKTLQQQKEHVDLAAVEEKLESKKKEKDELDAKLKEATRSADSWSVTEAKRRRTRDEALRAWQARRQRFGDGAEATQEAKRAYERANSDYLRAGQAKQASLGRVAHYGAQLGVVEADFRSLEGDRSVKEQEYRRRRAELEQRIEEGTRELRAEEERLQRWVRTLRELTPDQLKAPYVESLSEESRENSLFGKRVAFTYQLPRYNFFEQLRVVSDLSEGCPPKWTGVSEEELPELATTFSLEDSAPCTKGSKSEDWDKAAVYRYSYRAIYAIALVIPLMVFATKLLMAAELKIYYSVAAQAKAGNPDALLFKSIQQELHPDQQELHPDSER